MVLRAAASWIFFNYLAGSLSRSFLQFGQHHLTAWPLYTKTRASAISPGLSPDTGHVVSKSGLGLASAEPAARQIIRFARAGRPDQFDALAGLAREQDVIKPDAPPKSWLNPAIINPGRFRWHPRCPVAIAVCQSESVEDEVVQRIFVVIIPFVENIRHSDTLLVYLPVVSFWQ